MDKQPQPLELRHERLLAAAALLKMSLVALDENHGGMGQGYHLERLVERARLLTRIAAELQDQKSAGPSGPTLPA